MTKKEFALNQISPYYKDPSICGYNGASCEYITQSGKMCVMGKNLLQPEEFSDMNADEIINKYGEVVLKPEAREMLSPNEWKYLQSLHDNIAAGNKIMMARAIERLNLFTLEELENYSK